MDVINKLREIVQVHYTRLFVYAWTIGIFRIMRRINAVVECYAVAEHRQRRLVFHLVLQYNNNLPLLSPLGPR